MNSRSKLLIAGFLLILGWVNTQIFLKERALGGGERLVLQLAPADPRSLMQGDYMRLNYSLAEKLRDKPSGVAYLNRDSHGLATNLSSDGIPLKFQNTNGRVTFDIESFMFQEGKAFDFQRARYAELRVAKDGHPTLVRLLDEDFRPL